MNFKMFTSALFAVMAVLITPPMIVAKAVTTFADNIAQMTLGAIAQKVFRMPLVLLAMAPDFIENTPKTASAGSGISWLSLSKGGRLFGASIG